MSVSNENRLNTATVQDEAQKQALRSIMFAGTGSDVGKSVIAAGICRIVKQDGMNPAPFKAQNMALNSYVTPDGLELGRAQAMQAEACGIDCRADMNPILLKPQSDGHSQVVMLGKPIGTASAYSYFRKEGREHWRKVVHDAYDRLSREFSPIIMEGAGSISEINLRDVDIVNMSMARHADAAVVLVADIDRGGVFASVYGSVMLQTPEDRKRIKGIIINKFRGDIRLFQPGVKMIEDLCGIPVIGVIPYFRDIVLDAEDSLALDAKNERAVEGKLNIAVVKLPHISNFTDFDVLDGLNGVNLYYTRSNEELMKADLIILPGSKSTIQDLEIIKQERIDNTIRVAVQSGKKIIGICGGYQMMGQTVKDPLGMEGEAGETTEGLGLLPLDTELTGEKRTTRVNARLINTPGGRIAYEDTLPSDSYDITAYEIHVGRSDCHYSESSYPLCSIVQPDGTEMLEGMETDNCIGTYLHGIFDNRAFLTKILSPYSIHTSVEERARWKEEQYDKLAAHLREYLDVERLYEIMKPEACSELHN